MIVAKLLIDYTTLIDKKFDETQFFNPIQDSDGNWIVSIEESNSLEISEFQLIDYLQKIH
jgi:hypothetical protein